MDIQDSLNSMKFDPRLLEWNFRNGVISRKEYEKHLKSLSDSTDKGESIQIEDPEIIE